MNLVPTGSIISSWRPQVGCGHFYCVPFTSRMQKRCTSLDIKPCGLAHLQGDAGAVLFQHYCVNNKRRQT